MDRPSWLRPKWRESWDHPERVPDSRIRRVGFKRALRKHGLLSPHYSLAEAACHDGSPVPRRMRLRAQRHAFRLEQLRAATGGAALPVLSWYRTPAYNAQVGGASRSKHMKAIATDFDRGVVQARDDFDAVADRIFADGGFGQYPGGNRHVDSRHGRARWSSF